MADECGSCKHAAYTRHLDGRLYLDCGLDELPEIENGHCQGYELDDNQPPTQGEEPR